MNIYINFNVLDMNYLETPLRENQLLLQNIVTLSQTSILSLNVIEIEDQLCFSIVK